MNNQTKNYLKIAGIVVGAAALLTYPAMRMFRMMKQRKGNANTEEENVHTKAFAPSYRGSRKAHNRKAEANGHIAHV